MTNTNNINGTEIPIENIKPFVSLCKKLTGIYETNNYIEAIWLNGSRAVGRQRQDSDLDLVFIVKTEEYKTHLKETLKNDLQYEKFYDYFFNKIFEYWEYNNNEVGVHIYTKVEIKNKISNILSSIEFFENGQSFLQHNVINTLAIFDPNSILKELKEQAKYPEDLRKSQIEISLKRLKQEVEWWQLRKNWHSVFEEIHVIKLLIDEIAKCQYALNNRFFMVALKNYLYDQRELAPNIAKELNILTITHPKRNYNLQKRKALTSILDKLMTEYTTVYKTKELEL